MTAAAPFPEWTRDDLERVRAWANAAKIVLSTEDELRVYANARDQIVARCSFDVAILREPQRSRRSPAALERAKREARCELVHRIALAAGQYLGAIERFPQNRRRRFLESTIYRLVKAGDARGADMMAIWEEHWRRLERWIAEERTAFSRAAEDFLVLDIDQLLRDSTTLNSEPRQQKIAEVLVALKRSGSSEAETVRKRLQRLKRRAAGTSTLLFALTADDLMPPARYSRGTLGRVLTPEARAQVWRQRRWNGRMGLLAWFEEHVSPLAEQLEKTLRLFEGGDLAGAATQFEAFRAHVRGLQRRELELEAIEPSAGTPTVH